MEAKVLEAIKEKGIAEKMMITNDFISARHNLIKAQNLFPALENIGSMLAVCDILSAASIKFPDFGVDYYWVLQLPPLSSFSDIKRRYQKLVTMLQPLRYKFPGAESALKLVQDAFSVLSNGDKRSKFDLKRGASLKGYESSNVQTSLHNSTTNNEFRSTEVSPNLILGGKDGGAYALLKSYGTSEAELLTCHIIGKQHDTLDLEECSQLYNNTNCLCADKLESGESTNSPPPFDPNNSKQSLILSSLAMKRFDQDFYVFDNDRKAELFEPGEIWAAHFRANLFHNSRYAQVDVSAEQSVCVTWLRPVPISAGERRWCNAGLPVACGSFELDPDIRDGQSWPIVSSHKCSWQHGMTVAQFEIYPKSGEIWAVYKDWNLDKWASNPETVKSCKFELVEMLSDFSKYLGANGACLVKVAGFRSIFQRQTIGGSPFIIHIPPNNLYMFAHNVPAYRFRGGEIDKVVNGMLELDQLALPDDMSKGTNSLKEPEEENSRSFSFELNQLMLPSDIIYGIKSWKESKEKNFRNFSSCSKQLHPVNTNWGNKLLSPSWSSNDFAAGQIWAVYCRRDLMRRQYTRVDNVISESQVFVTILEPLEIHDSETKWKKENLPIVCGLFRAGEASGNLEMSQFSHPVKCQRSTTEPLYRIYPLKGEIWATFKNWNNKWKDSDYDSCQCGIVEILSDFSERHGVTIAKLGEVKGCLTFFQWQQYDGFDLTHVISKSDIHSFSHRIPAFRVPGIGNYGIPESSWHLEPNALPPRHQN